MIRTKTPSKESHREKFEIYSVLWPTVHTSENNPFGGRVTGEGKEQGENPDNNNNDNNSNYDSNNNNDNEIIARADCSDWGDEEENISDSGMLVTLIVTEIAIEVRMCNYVCLHKDNHCKNHPTLIFYQCIPA